MSMRSKPEMVSVPLTSGPPIGVDAWVEPHVMGGPFTVMGPGGRPGKDRTRVAVLGLAPTEGVTVTPKPAGQLRLSWKGWPVTVTAASGWPLG